EGAAATELTAVPCSGSANGSLLGSTTCALSAVVFGLDLNSGCDMSRPVSTTVIGTPAPGASTWSSPMSWIHHSLGTSGSSDVVRRPNQTKGWSGSARVRMPSARSAVTVRPACAAGTRHTFSEGDTRRAPAARSAGERPPPGSESWTRVAVCAASAGVGRAAGWLKTAAGASVAVTRAARMTPMVERPLKPGKQSTIAYIGLGANLGDRERTIASALRALDADECTSVLRSTAAIETDPVGYEDQPRFLNAAARLETTRSA